MADLHGRDRFSENSPPYFPMVLEKVQAVDRGMWLETTPPLHLLPS